MYAKKSDVFSLAEKINTKTRQGKKQITFA
jgi:hypothetical protein